jgi:hypothetical protein
MIKVITVLSFAVLGACSGHKDSVSAVQGAPHELGVLCTSADTDSSFRIYEGQGMLQRYGKPALLFTCEQIVSLDDAVFVNSPARMMYECREKDQPEGAEVSVYRTGEDSQIKASVTEKKGGFEVAKLSCQK